MTPVRAPGPLPLAVPAVHPSSSCPDAIFVFSVSSDMKEGVQQIRHPPPPHLHVLPPVTHQAAVRRERINATSPGRFRSRPCPPPP